ncbi:hypothetical protein CVT26_003253 [Gymnopilus dilepis]|uniref:Uncharacterized protein n=1 Tax=Gymnopilus dilepis TaxID=231916 RepID=A0A409X9L4_9AGAR|nr:hypothetical protein CVT26_003253 [Gymnopilus dilepis]
MPAGSSPFHLLFTVTTAPFLQVNLNLANEFHIRNTISYCHTLPVGLPGSSATAGSLARCTLLNRHRRFSQETPHTQPFHLLFTVTTAPFNKET